MVPGKCADGLSTPKRCKTRTQLPGNLKTCPSLSSFSCNRNSPFRVCSVAAAGRQRQQQSTQHFSRPRTAPSSRLSPASWRNPIRAPRSVVARASDQLLPLGLDFLTFLGATVLVIPVFKSLKISPVLGFLFSGLVLQQLG